MGHWIVDVSHAGPYDVTVRLPAQPEDATIRLSLGKIERSASLPRGAKQVVFEGVPLEPGEVRVEAVCELGAKRFGAHYVDLLGREVASSAGKKK